jgi:competence protein ComFC
MFNIVFDILFPPKCAICGAYDRGAICTSCETLIQPLKSPFCRICGKPKDRFFQKDLCNDCNSGYPVFNMARSAFIYDGVLKEALHKFKFCSKKKLGEALGVLLSKHLSASDIPLQDIDVIIPIPLPRKRQQERGYNQSAVIAEILAGHFNIELDVNSLIKIKDIKRQHDLKREDRFVNIKGAFKCRKTTYKKALLIDDIYTTGATVQEASLAMKDAGITDIYVMTLARAIET